MPDKADGSTRGVGVVARGCSWHLFPAQMAGPCVTEMPASCYIEIIEDIKGKWMDLALTLPAMVTITDGY